MVLVMSTNSELLELYVEAEKKILRGQAVRFGDRTLTRADLDIVRKERTRLQRVVDQETTASNGNGRSRFSQATFSRGSSCDWNYD